MPEKVEIDSCGASGGSNAYPQTPNPSKTMDQTRYFKLFNRDEWHHGYQYEDGLNVDSVPFDFANPDTGMYFYSESQLIYWRCHVSFDPVWIRQVFIPCDAVVTQECGCSRASKLILGPRHSFDHEDYSTGGVRRKYIRELRERDAKIASEQWRGQLEGCLEATKQVAS